MDTLRGDPHRLAEASAPSAAPWRQAASPVVAVMQPYFLPYLGYLSLVAACDTFVFYDDVQHIPRGWVHRNRILIDGAAHTFTVPLAMSSRNRLLGEVGTHDFARFRRQFQRQLECAYRRAPQFEPTMALLREVLGDDEPGIAELAMRSVQVLCAALGIERRFLRSSQGFAGSRGLPRAERLAAITRELGATRYVNSPGGDALYTREEFAALGVSLRFVRPRLPPYPQMGSTGFVAGLSVVDALMNNPLPEVARLARQFVLD